MNTTMEDKIESEREGLGYDFNQLVKLGCGCEVHIGFRVPAHAPYEHNPLPTGETKKRCFQHEYPIRWLDDVKLISDAWKEAKVEL